jgi:hypothetical protein
MVTALEGRVNVLPNSEWGDAVASSGVFRMAVSTCLVGALGISACGGGSTAMPKPPTDPVATALMAPGVRTVVIPKQSAALTIVVPPCGLAKTQQQTTRTPPGSNQVVVPQSALDQTIAIQPCMQGAEKSAGGSSTVLLSPGGTGSAASQESPPPNQLLLPKNSNVTKLIVPPCLVLMSSSSSGGQSGGPNAVLPGARRQGAVTAPPCTVQMTSSSSS